MNYVCNNCKKVYQSRMGIYRHKKTCVDIIKDVKTENNICCYCTKVLCNYTSKWRHEKICKYNGKTNIVIKSLENEVTKLKNYIKEPDKCVYNKISELVKEMDDLKNKPTIININKNNTIHSYENKVCELYINNSKVLIYDNYYFDANEICNLCNKSFNDWYNFEFNNNVIYEIEKITNIPKENLIKKENNNILLIHPFIAMQLFQWISPIYGIIFNDWLIKSQVNDKETIIKKKEIEVRALVENFVKKHPREKYPDKNVIYLLTTEFHKKNKTYIVGKAEDLAGRLSTYNKTCDHEVVYYKSCGEKEILGTVENMVLKKLNPYREVANRDRFILPHGKDISFFTDIIEQAIEFFNDGESVDTTDIPKTNTKQKIINEIETLLDEINSKSYFAQPSV